MVFTVFHRLYNEKEEEFIHKNNLVCDMLKTSTSYKREKKSDKIYLVEEEI